MNDVQAYVKKAFDKDIDCNRRTLTRDIKKKFGEGLSFVHLRKLTDAYKAGKYDQRAPKILAEVEKKRQEKVETAKRSGGKRGRPKGSKNKPKARGERRGAAARRGRRKADAQFVAFDSVPNHLVVVFSEGSAEDHRFKSRADAEAKLRSLIASGVQPNRIAYYKKQDVKVAVTI